MGIVMIGRISKAGKMIGIKETVASRHTTEMINILPRDMGRTYTEKKKVS